MRRSILWRIDRGDSQVSAQIVPVRVTERGDRAIKKYGA